LPFVELGLKDVEHRFLIPSELVEEGHEPGTKARLEGNQGLLGDLDNSSLARGGMVALYRGRVFEQGVLKAQAKLGLDVGTRDESTPLQ